MDKSFAKRRLALCTDELEADFYEVIAKYPVKVIDASGHKGHKIVVEADDDDDLVRLKSFLESWLVFMEGLLDGR